jgi:chloride channel protein, CIC family
LGVGRGLPGGSLERLRQSEDQLSLVLSLVIGALVGPGGSGVHPAHRTARGPHVSGGRIGLAAGPGSGARLARHGLSAVAVFPVARGSGIPQTKFALFINDGRILFRTVVGKFFCCSASLASGIALGREGPSVQVGAGIASVVARNLGLRSETGEGARAGGLRRGAGGGLQYAHRGGPVLARRDHGRSARVAVLGSVVLSSATSWMVLHLVLGDDPLFHVAGYRLVHPGEFAVYAVLGVVGGLGSVCFVKLLLGLRAWFMRLPKWTVWFQPVAGGLTVGLMGYFVPEVMGVGYNHVEKVLNGDIVLKLVVLLAVLKIVATAVCYASGNAGGIFGPACSSAR